MMVDTMSEKSLLRRSIPFLLTIFIVVADQWSKAWIVANVPQGTMYASYLNDFISIWHVRNQAIGFSIGAGLPMVAKILLFIVLPLGILTFMVIFLLRTKELTGLQHWLSAALVGGGLGNIIDRIFREDWVVDFVSLRIYGLFGLERWPTFNVADSTVVITGIALMLTILFGGRSREKQKQSTDGTD